MFGAACLGVVVVMALVLARALMVPVFAIVTTLPRPPAGDPDGRPARP